MYLAISVQRVATVDQLAVYHTVPATQRAALALPHHWVAA